MIQHRNTSILRMILHRLKFKTTIKSCLCLWKKILEIEWPCCLINLQSNYIVLLELKMLFLEYPTGENSIFLKIKMYRSIYAFTRKHPRANYPHSFLTAQTSLLIIILTQAKFKKTQSHMCKMMLIETQYLKRI